MADIRTWLGLAAWKLGGYTDARRQGEAALELKRRLGLDHSIQLSYNALGLLAWHEGKLDEAVTRFAAALGAAEAVGDRLTAGKVASNIALVEVELARYDRAAAGFRRALDIARELGDAKLHGNALLNLGMLDVRVGDAASAVPLLLEARRLHASIAYIDGEQNALGQLGTAYAAAGNLSRAFAALDSANDLAMRHGLEQEVASNLEVMGDLYRDAGDLPKALRHYERAQSLNGELGLELERGSVLRKVAAIHRALGVSIAARTSAATAAGIHEAQGARFEEVQDLLLLAEIDGERVSTHLERAEQLVRAIGTPKAVALAALTSARLSRRSGDWARVLMLLASAEAAIRRSGFDAEAEAEALRAEALSHTARPQEARAAADRAAAALERARLGIGSGLLRAAFAADHAPLYASLIDTELRLGRPADGLRMAELARSRDIGVTGATPDTLIATLRRIRALTAALNNLLDAGDAPPAEVDALETELTGARADYESVLVRGRWNEGSREVATADEIAGVLRPGEVLLEYSIGGDAVFGFVVTSGYTRAQVLPVTRAELRAAIDIGRDALIRTGGDPTATMENLYTKLLQPFANELDGARRLIVVPHGALSSMPFAALRNPVTHRYAIEDFVIEYLPASTDVKRLRAREALTTLPPAVVFAPFPRELPGSRREGRAVAAAWPRTTVVRGRHATEAALRAALGTDAIAHVGSHAASDARTPLFSHVSLRSRGDDDGRLEIHEVFATRVRSPLVVLSGCETGPAGTNAAGLGIGGDAGTFVQAFLAAGARAVLATAWRIEDESAGMLAGEFYRSLRRADAAASLADAQRALIRSRRYRHPFYWAAYMLTGELGMAVPAD